jgi:hypothetical protein
MFHDSHSFAHIQNAAARREEARRKGGERQTNNCQTTSSKAAQTETVLLLQVQARRTSRCIVEPSWIDGSTKTLTRPLANRTINTMEPETERLIFFRMRWRLGLPWRNPGRVARYLTLTGLLRWCQDSKCSWRTDAIPLPP